MHITPYSPVRAERTFALQMLFLGLGVLLGLVVIIQYGSPGHRMNADSIYATPPVYTMPRSGRPTSNVQKSSSNTKSIRSAISERNVNAAGKTTRSAPRVRRHSLSRSSARSIKGTQTPKWFWR
jgi:hypothetical protein